MNLIKILEPRQMEVNRQYNFIIKNIDLSEFDALIYIGLRENDLLQLLAAKLPLTTKIIGVESNPEFQNKNKMKRHFNIKIVPKITDVDLSLYKNPLVLIDNYLSNFNGFDNLLEDSKNFLDQVIVKRITTLFFEKGNLFDVEKLKREQKKKIKQSFSKRYIKRYEKTFGKITTNADFINFLYNYRNKPSLINYFAHFDYLNMLFGSAINDNQEVNDGILTMPFNRNKIIVENLLDYDLFYFVKDRKKIEIQEKTQLYILIYK